MKLRRALLRWTPPVFADALRAVMNLRTTFSGAYASWGEAAVVSSGYGSEQLLQRVLDSSRKVRDGHARYERDSVLFDHIEYSFPVVATLLRAALENEGALSVIDFGGALGSSYRECKPFLGDRVGPLRWSIVEQAVFVAAGQREMQCNELRFFSSIHEAAQGHTVDVLLFSGVLQYLPDPYSTIDEAIQLGPRYVVLDRTIVSTRPVDAVHVQRVPQSIYAASYPVWALSKERILARLQGRYELLSEHASLVFPELASIGAEFKGFVFQAKVMQ